MLHFTPVFFIIMFCLPNLNDKKKTTIITLSDKVVKYTQNIQLTGNLRRYVLTHFSVLLLHFTTLGSFYLH